MVMQNSLAGQLFGGADIPGFMGDYDYDPYVMEDATDTVYCIFY